MVKDEGNREGKQGEKRNQRMRNEGEERGRKFLKLKETLSIIYHPVTTLELC